MSLDKAIEHGKEHRKHYRGAKAVDTSCRNHGDCEWCRSNRTHKNDKKMQETIDDIINELADYYKKDLDDIITNNTGIQYDVELLTAENQELVDPLDLIRLDNKILARTTGNTWVEVGDVVAVEKLN